VSAVAPLAKSVPAKAWPEGLYMHCPERGDSRQKDGSAVSALAEGDCCTSCKTGSCFTKGVSVSFEVDIVFSSPHSSMFVYCPNSSFSLFFFSLLEFFFYGQNLSKNRFW